ncbi:2-phospho-L-lactate transferase [Nocardioides sp. URHA0020]|uniref:2-phospho-L-lactate transferase n=1 Tax=Nocardioides sp. URHA0020 TaxID=1380392 RepID=UPI000491F2C3|nr:2-phospho-L-lactate transferase [Nocardioides sp. URHA0020]
MQNITVLSGGMGGARFLQGLLHGIAGGRLPGVAADATVTVVANTADDIWVHGLKVCPDLDTVMYTLGDGIDPERGWGRRDETWSTKDELATYGVEPTWFGLGDRDIATHLVRTQMLDAGYPLSEVTTALCRRWLTPTYGDRVRLLPMTDDRVETHVAIADPESPSGRRVVHFQEYWVRLRASVPAELVVVVGLEDSSPGPGVIDAITDADLVVLPPSNPVVSVGTILGVPRVREALAATAAPVVGLSPIVGGTHVRGMAEQMLTSIGVEVSAAGVGLHYGSRAHGGVLDGWLVDLADADQVGRIEAGGLPCRAVPLMMTDPDATAAMAAAAVELVSR